MFDIVWVQRAVTTAKEEGCVEARVSSNEFVGQAALKHEIPVPWARVMAIDILHGRDVHEHGAVYCFGVIGG